jgi:transposase
MTSTIDSAVLSVEQAARFTPEQIVELLRSHTTLREEVSALKHQLEWFKRQLFGQKSERRIIESAPGQMSLGEALDQAQTGVAPEPKSRRIDAHTRRVTTKRPEADEDSVPFFDESRVPVEVIDVPAPEVAGLAADQFEIIGHKESFRLAQRPGSYVVLKYRRPVIKRKDTQVITCPSAPVGVIDQSRADVSFVTGLLIDKFAYHLPLYRQHQRLADSHITVSRAWLTQIAQKGVALLEPIYEAQLDSIRASRVKAMDETSVKAGRAQAGKLKQGYFWPVYGERDEVCFPFFDNRSGSSIEAVLGLKATEGGVLLTDGYDPYAIYAQKIGITHAQCWAHYLECRFILSCRPKALIVCSVPSLPVARSGEQTPHNTCHRIDGEHRVGGWFCKCRCGRSRVSKRTLRAVNGAMRVCLHVPCTRLAAVHLRVMEATHAQHHRECALLDGIALRDIKHSACCRTFWQHDFRAC